MDLKNFDISAGETGVELTILDLDNKPTDIKIKVLSFHGKKGREVFLETLRKTNADGTLAKSQSEILAGLTVGWKGISEGEKELKFSREEAVRVYETYPIIAGQVERFTEDAKNFLKK